MQSTSLSFFNYSVKNASGGSLDLYIDGDIVDAPTQELYREFWGDETSVSYKSVRDQVLNAKPKVLNVWVNSGGGQVTEAMAMHDFLADLESKGTEVNRYGRGIIASAATYLLMGKNSEISKNSWFMIHNVSGGVWGDVNDIENAAKVLRKFNDQVRDLYVTYTGLSKETITAWMNQETWFNGDEAAKNGFVKKTSPTVDFTNSIRPESWPFQNKNVLIAYNSFAKNKPDEMKFDLKKITDTVTESVKKALNIGTDKEVKPSELKAEDLQNTISTSVTNAFEAVQDTLQTAIDTAVKEGVDTALKTVMENALKADGDIAKAINAAMTEALKDKGAIANAVAAATKDLVTNETLEKLKTDLADKVGNQGSGKNKGNNNSGGDAEDKGAFAHDDIEWGNKN